MPLLGALARRDNLGGIVRNNEWLTAAALRILKGREMRSIRSTHLTTTTNGDTTRSRRRSTTLLLALVALVSLIAAGCGSSTTDIDASGTTAAASASDDQSSSDSSSSDSSSDSSSSSSSSNSSRESPIGDLLGIPAADDDAMEEYFGQLQKDAEQKIAECMIGEGFEYTPPDYSAFESIGAADFESREFAEERGFGSNPFAGGAMQEAFEDFTDPNQEYVESLTQGEREAYQTALSGNPPDFDPSSDDEFIFEPSGCQGDAYESVFSFGQVFEQFNDEFESMEENFAADPRIVVAQGDWSRCMSDAGFSYASAEDARESFSDRYETIMRSGDIFEMPEIDPDNPPEEGDTIFSGPPAIKPEAQVELDAILEEEIDVATATWDCSEPMKELEREVRLEMEQDFVDNYGDAIRAALDEA